MVASGATEVPHGIAAQRPGCCRMMVSAVRPPSKYKIEPMDLANIRQNGVRSLLVMCYGCQHEVVINVDQYPGELLVREFGTRMVCTNCGMVGADVRPNWKERSS
jgi:hypothetical protein